MDYYSYGAQSAQLSPAYLISACVIALVVLIATWRMYTKAGQPGWACIIPIYSTWVLYKIICGRGKAMFRLLIPFYNIYWAIKSEIKLAHAYGKSTGFGVGLIFLPVIFYCILGFGGDKYVGPQDM